MCKNITHFTHPTHHVCLRDCYALRTGAQFLLEFFLKTTHYYKRSEVAHGTLRIFPVIIGISIISVSLCRFLRFRPNTHTLTARQRSYYINDSFLPRDAYVQRGLCCGKMSVRPSVCLSHAGILSSNCFYCRVATPLQLFRTKRYHNTPTQTP